MNTHELAELILNRLHKIEEKVDAVHRHCNQIDVTLAAQAKDIEHHIRRTDLLEKRLEQHEPIRWGIKSALWLLGFISTLMGLAVAWQRLPG